jgi:hypothetical protein
MPYSLGHGLSFAGLGRKRLRYADSDPEFFVFVGWPAAFSTRELATVLPLPLLVQNLTFRGQFMQLAPPLALGKNCHKLVNGNIACAPIFPSLPWVRLALDFVPCRLRVS